METVTYVQMDYHEFEALVKKTYGPNYEFVADIECGNDTDHSYERMSKRDLDPYEHRELQKFVKSGSYSCISYILMQDLVNKGLLPEGNILIQVSW